MARICSNCENLCIYFLLVLRISSAISEGSQYQYKTDFPPQSISGVVLLEDKHHMHKRDTNNSSATKDPTTTPITIPVKPKPSNPAQLAPTKPTNFKKIHLDKTPPLIHSSPNDTKNDATTLQPSYVTSSTTAAPKQDIQKKTAVKVTTPSDALDASELSETSKKFNETLTKNNITITRKDTHLYYNSTFKTDPKTGQFYWVKLSEKDNVVTNDLLSNSHRRAATVTLSFDFPFYGHMIKNVTIATGGFLYTGDHVHSWLAATQYIAPLMANFDTSLGNDSFIKYHDNGTAFTVEWANVSLQDKPEDGKFTFQTTLFNNGDIVFVYENVPVIIENITDEFHPVKIGLSDAYVIDRTVLFSRRKTIYEYDKVHFDKGDIQNWTVIYFTALATCLNNIDCTSCLSADIPKTKCTWCPVINRCSSGSDRHRQEWLVRGCEKKKYEQLSMCAHVNPVEIFNDNDTTYIHDSTEFQNALKNQESKPTKGSLLDALGPKQPVRMGVSGVIAILFLVTMIFGIAIWILYAYRNPHTTSGQILIRYRPSQWSWRRGEARYTAATIHM